MRMLAIVILVGFVTVLVADEPNRNPFRDGTGKASPAVPATPKSTPDVKPEPIKPDPIRQGPRVVRASEVGVGRLVPDIAFADITGKAGQLSDFKSSKLLVIAFTEDGCPLCKKYAPTLAAIEKEFDPKGVEFLFVNPSADRPKQSPFSGRYIHDQEGKLIAALGARTSTEVFVLDSSRTIVYRGAVDDQYGLGYAIDEPKNNYLKAALAEALAGKPPVIGATTAPGCELSSEAKPLPTPLTYHAAIERIIQQNCVECHRSGGLAPFALETYEQVVAKRAVIKRVLADRTMPPWFAAPPEQGQHSLWSNDRSLTDTDKSNMLAWLAGDLKKGNPADAPLPRTFESGWLIGKPDAVFQMPKPIAVKATGTMPYQVVSVDTNFDEEHWVQAMEVQPSAREVVHHVLIFATPKGAPRGAAEAQGFFAAYVPGNNTLIYPEGYAKRLPKNATITFQMHYTPNGKATEDQTRFGMIFAKEKPQHEVKVAALAKQRFSIPPGADNYKIEAKMPFVPWNARVLAFFPHAHLRGKAARYDVKFPDGTTKNLLEVPHYDFNWQLMYRLAEPVSIPRGSSLTYTAWYDNSDKNPANPDPKRAVPWGPQTYDEMHLGYLEYVID